MEDSGLLSVLYEHKEEKGAVIPILQGIQEKYGYLPPEILERFSELTSIPLAQIYGVATFFAQFRFEPRGKHLIRVCHGTACHVNGAERISSAIEEYLGIKEKETTLDGKFSVENVACLGCCSLAPVVMIDEKTYGRLTGEQIKKILKGY